MILRDYQEPLVQSTLHDLHKGIKVVMQMPCGGGKTRSAVEACRRFLETRHGGVLWIAHRQELLQQASDTLYDYFGDSVGIIGGGERSYGEIQVASIQSAHKIDNYEQFGLLVIDECHLSGANSYTKLLNKFSGKPVLGLTATPVRGDGKPLGGIFDAIHCGPTVRELMDRGFLAEYSVVGSSLDRKQFAMGTWDFDSKEAAGIVRKLRGLPVEEYIRWGNNGRVAVFCCTKEHAKEVEELYKAAGFSTELVLGETAKRNRANSLDAIRCGDSQVLVGVGCFVEGLDIPELSVCQFLRPTKSLSFYLQAVGRVLRLKEDGRPAVILDHVGNVSELGLPCKDRDWCQMFNAAHNRRSKLKKSPKSIEEVLKILENGTIFEYEEISLGLLATAGSWLEDIKMFRTDADAYTDWLKTVSANVPFEEFKVKFKALNPETSVLGPALAYKRLTGVEVPQLRAAARRVSYL